MRLTTPIIAFVVLLTSACGPEATGGSADGSPSPDVAAEPAVRESIGPATGVDEPNAQPAVLAAAARRLSIDQLEGSIPVLTGSEELGWRFKFNGSLYEGFKTLGVTLGRPDYFQLTEESRESTALYVKLMGDMSADVCEKVLAADAERDLEERTFLRFEDLGDTDEAVIRENLRYLKLFYLGEYVTDDAGVDDLAAVFEIAFTEADDAGVNTLLSVRDGWKAVCMAMLASPNFHIY